MTGCHKPADRFHAETGPLKWMCTQTTCWQTTAVCSRGLSSKSCACVERGARLMVCMFMGEELSSATGNLPLEDTPSIRPVVELAQCRRWHWATVE